MIVNGAYLLPLLILLQITNLYAMSERMNQMSHDTVEMSHDSVGLSKDSMCVDNMCTVTPDNVWRLQDMIQSNQTLQFEDKRFYMRKMGFATIENVSNVVISGYGQGTHIECSHGANFGFYFKNVINVTITGLRITNCGVPVPHHLEQNLRRSHDLPCDIAVCAPVYRDVHTTILLQRSSNVTLSNVEITQSFGFALTAIDSPSKSRNKHMQTHDLVMNNCRISHSQTGSLLLHGLSAMLVQSTLTNSSIGIAATSANVELQDSDISHCTVSSVESGSLVLSGSVIINQSSIHLRGQVLTIRRGNVLFASSGREPTSQTVLTATGGEVDIEQNSEILFAGFNLSTHTSALRIVGTTLIIQDNSSLSFVDNLASDRASVFAILESSVSVADQATVRLSRNSVNNAWIILAAFESDFITGNDAMIDICDNGASDSGTIAEFYKTDVIFHHNTIVSMKNNSITTQSTLVTLNDASFEFYEKSTFKLEKNSAVNQSQMLMMAGNISFYDNVEVVIRKNNVTQESSILTLRSVSPIETERDLYYYIQLVEDQNEEEESIEANRRIRRQIGTPLITRPLPDGPEKPPPDGTPPISNGPPSGPGKGSNVDNFPSGTDAPNSNITPILDDAPPFIPVPKVLSLPPAIDISGENASVSFYSNTITDRSSGVTCVECTIVTRGSGKLLLTNNTCHSASYVTLLNNATTLIRDRSVVEILHNVMTRDSSTLLSQHGVWRTEPDTVLSVTSNRADNGFSILLFSMMVELSGTVLVTNNTLSDFGVLNFINTEVSFYGKLESIGNRAESGVISADNSDLYITNEATFSDNSASNGGALSLISSVLHVSPNAVVNFTRNHATGLGGAVYISNPRTNIVCDALTSTASSCSIQVFNKSPNECDLFALHFNQNTAGIAGGAMYGGRTSACIPSTSNTFCTNCLFPDASDMFQYHGTGDNSDLSNFTSDPTRVCFCKNGVPDCYGVSHDVTVHPGEQFNLSVAIVGYGLGTVPGSVVARTNREKVRDAEKNSFGSNLQYSQEIGTECQDVSYSVLSKRAAERIILAVNTQSFGRSMKEAEAVVDFQRTRETSDISPILRSPYDSVYETFFHIPVFVNVNLLPCPIGFQLSNGRCTCHEILLDNNIDTCVIDNGIPLINRPSPYWIGLPDDNMSSILIHSQCPFDYCQSDDSFNITVTNSDGQCQYQRSGILCGQCRDGLSMVVGSSECKTCSNMFLSSIIVFGVAGVALVALLTLLNMTVSVGTLNGLILFANIIQANRSTFLPPTTSSASVPIAILSTFISWVNLDLGIPICLFDGLTTYVKTWLQFLFPLYILTIVGVIIIASYYSTRVTKLFGTNSVSVLATLVLLSYAKILRVLITVFSFTTLQGTRDYHKVVWLADGNVDYFEAKHGILFITALFVLLILGIPYTTTLIVAPWIQRSKYFWLSKTYNKFKPLFDAYMGPYKDNRRYWTGMLLLARVILIVLFSSIANADTVSGPALNLLLLTLSAAGLLALTAAVKPYKTKLNNAIEIFYLTILVIFSAANLYSSNATTAGMEDRAYIYIALVGTCFIAFLCMGIGHAWYRIQTAQYGTWTWQSKSKHAPPGVAVEEGEEERGTGTSMSTQTTDIITASDRERRDSMFLCMGIGHAWHRIQTVRYGTWTWRSKSKRRTQHAPPGAAVEEGEEERGTGTSMSTQTTDINTASDRERRDSMFRESVLDLSDL